MSDRPLDPEKVLRLASLTRAVLEEVRQMDPDEHTVGELAALHGRVMSQLQEALPKELLRELEQIDLDLPFTHGPSPNEVRLAYAGLIGWLGGLFQGLQAAMQLQHVRTLELERAQEEDAMRGRRREPEESPPRGQYL
ncbi:MAG: proteasome activator [Actinomycetota bacterium]